MRERGRGWEERETSKCACTHIREREGGGETIRLSGKSQNTHTSYTGHIANTHTNAVSFSRWIAYSRAATLRRCTRIQRNAFRVRLFLSLARACRSFTSLPLSLPLSAISSCVSLSPFITCLYPFVHLRLRVGYSSVRECPFLYMCTHIERE